ncbi:MAG: hypothetical protein ABIP81_08325 [Terriglobales bacterium]
MIQLSLADFRADLSTAALAALQLEFEEFHTFQVREFLHPDLLAFVLERIRPEDFIPRSHGKIGNELAVDTLANVGVQSLVLRMNDRALASFMEAVTGITPVKHFEGRVYRMMPPAEHYDSWHDDVSQGRLIGMSINFSPVPYRGGTFSIRRHSSNEVLRALPNLGPGDAIFFRISNKLQHMVSRIEGTTSKTAFAGWFHDASFLTDYLRTPKAPSQPAS